MPSGPSKDYNEVGFSPGKSPPTALIRAEQSINTNCCSSIHDNNCSPDNSFQTLARNIAISGIKKSKKTLRFTPYMRPDVAEKNKDDQVLALFGPVPSPESFSLSFSETLGSVTPSNSCADNLSDHILDDEMVFQELECITNSLAFPISPPLSPTTATATATLDNDFTLFP
ncbi:hypothetical protein BD408DRAFT_425213 [Parasitella parasitica]|nr:hypothetical protein BD408DRAFT_425213 [Parasitella parasitica]